MAGIPDELPKITQSKIKRVVCNKLIRYLKEFNPEIYFDGDEEIAFASSYYIEEVLSELISTIATCR